MRKTYAWNVLRTTRSIPATQRALQHAFLSTTMIYIADGLQWLLVAFYGQYDTPILKPALSADLSQGENNTDMG